MTTYLITYDLKKPGQDYDELYSEIESLADDYIHPCESNWFVTSGASATEIRDRLSPKTDVNDELIVVKATTPGAWKDLSSDETAWLKDNL